MESCSDGVRFMLDDMEQTQRFSRLASSSQGYSLTAKKMLQAGSLPLSSSSVLVHNQLLESREGRYMSERGIDGSRIHR